MDDGQQFPNGQPTAFPNDGVVITSDGTSPKKKIVVIFAVIALVAVIVAISMVFIFSKQGSNNNEQGTKSIAAAKSAFNSYANYVLSGSYKDGDISQESLAQAPYYLSLGSADLTGYINTANEKYLKLEDNYYNNGGKADIAQLKVYYQDYVANMPISDSQILESYKTVGRDTTLGIIEERYNAIGKNPGLIEYLETEKNLAEVKVDILAGAEAAGCLSADNIAACYTPTEEISAQLSELLSKASSIISEFKSLAYGAFVQAYRDIYGVAVEASV